MILLRYMLVPKDQPKAYTPSVICNDPKVVTCWECNLEGEYPESACHQATSDSPVNILKAKDMEKDPNLYGDLIIHGL
eukprot:4488530-Ditylum_brightwellii.AAC.1